MEKQTKQSKYANGIKCLREDHKVLERKGTTSLLGNSQKGEVPYSILSEDFTIFTKYFISLMHFALEKKESRVIISSSEKVPYSILSEDFTIFTKYFISLMHFALEKKESRVIISSSEKVECYGDVDGSGRRKREIPKFLPHYTNEAFEVEVSAFLRLKSDVEGDIIFEDSK
ncbi:uncharacterized protein CDAR_402571 [Caerostris darwini]|uniref:Uncharacterized protein n=1 Tax=Caerostris darwini TaxID=1538125 RepID=A0AAV4RUK6_9ARAC|nr:uncharacterized protein CDAR_402571 [Caerostris darwini]